MDVVGFESYPLYDTFLVLGDVRVTVAQATESDMAQRRASIPRNGKGIVSREIARKEAYLTLSSIANLTDDRGRDLFPSTEGMCGVRVRYAMSETRFNRVWGAMDSKVVEEIHSAVQQHNQHWFNTDWLFSHLSRLRDSIVAWHEYEEAVQSGKVALKDYEVEMGIATKPVQPEPLAEYRRLSRFNFSHLIYPGGLHAQPHIWLLEIKTCMEMEKEREYLDKMNRQLQRAAPKPPQVLQ